MAAEVPTEAVVRASPDQGQAESWTLVLEAMAIPHKTAAYSKLRKVVELPEPKITASPGAGRTGRSRRPG